MVKRENAYEVWQSRDGLWVWYVLKKYQSPEKEKENPFARWFVSVDSPFVINEMGDTYVEDIVSNAIRIK